jgi:hypothetical protein
MREQPHLTSVCRFEPLIQINAVALPNVLRAIGMLTWFVSVMIANFILASACGASWSQKNWPSDA